MINKKKIVLNLAKEYCALPEEEPAAFFMAGLPGSGKTEISKNLIKESGIRFLRIDMDEIAELLPEYAPEKADEFRKPATSILNECLNYAIHHKISFILDGTFGSTQAIKNIERSLKHGFTVQVIYVFQDPKLAWNYTLAREKVEHRSIKFDGFIESYYKTINNLKTLLKTYDGSVAVNIAVKTSENTVGEWEQSVNARQFDDIVKPEYNKDKLIKYVLGA